MRHISTIGRMIRFHVVLTVMERSDPTARSESWRVPSKIHCSSLGKLLTLPVTTVRYTEQLQADIAQLHRYCAVYDRHFTTDCRIRQPSTGSIKTMKRLPKTSLNLKRIKGLGQEADTCKA